MLDRRSFFHGLAAAPIAGVAATSVEAEPKRELRERYVRDGYYPHEEGPGLRKFDIERLRNGFTPPVIRESNREILIPAPTTAAELHVTCFDYICDNYSVDMFLHAALPKQLVLSDGWTISRESHLNLYDGCLSVRGRRSICVKTLAGMGYAEDDQIGYHEVRTNDFEVLPYRMYVSRDWRPFPNTGHVNGTVIFDDPEADAILVGTKGCAHRHMSEVPLTGGDLGFVQRVDPDDTRAGVFLFPILSQCIPAYRREIYDPISDETVYSYDEVYTHNVVRGPDGNLWPRYVTRTMTEA